jgi:Family of unknown function (DUF5996)
VERWPQLRIADWTDTRDTLHLWTQIVGKIRLRQEPMLNHWWNVTLYVTPRGLTTSTMPYAGGRSFRIDFDFLEHRLVIDGCDREFVSFQLAPMTVAAFYDRVMDALHQIGITVHINTMPNEIPDAIPFEKDTVHASYDKDAVERFFRVLLQADRLCKIFRSGFLGKASPVHFFWGSFDLAVTRFSGRTAPPHPGGIPNLPDWVTREAYSHEEQSVGFWPGGMGMDALFYAYAYPEPKGFAQAGVMPAAAGWNTTLKEFVLPYEAVRLSSDPDAGVLSFFRSTYEAASVLASWDRTLLDRVAGTSHDSKSKLKTPSP